MKDKVKSLRTVVCVILVLILYSCVSEDVSKKREERTVNRLYIEVVDGDTVVYKGLHMRFLGVDTPEIRNPEHGFYRDQPYGREAKNFTRMEIKRAKKVTYMADGYDRYGRLLVHVFVDGYPLSLRIVEEKYGYETVSVYGDNGFPDIARRIVEASKLAGRPPFENPYIWRIKNRRD